MNAVFFPFTFVSAEIARAIHRRLGQFVVYQPVSGEAPPEMMQLSDDGLIEIRYPILGGEARLMELCRAYRQWGDIHQGHIAALKQRLTLRSDNEMRPTEIRSEILTGAQPVDARDPDPVTAARLFLQMAQTFDMQQAELDLDLDSIDRTEEQLFNQLTDGEAGLFTRAKKRSGPVIATGDNDPHYVSSRMTAWGALSASDRPSSAVYVTHSRAVMDLISDSICEPCHTLSISGLPQLQAADESQMASQSPWMSQLCRMTTGSLMQTNDFSAAAFLSADGLPDDGYQFDIAVIPMGAHHAPADILFDAVRSSDHDETNLNRIVIALLAPRV